MAKIIKRTSISVILIMILPLSMWISGWQWQPNINYHYWFKGWYWLTQTASLPWSIFISIILTNYFLWYLKLNYNPTKILSIILILFFILSIGQCVKYLIKEIVQEPRPFVVWIANYCHHINDQKKYLKSQKELNSIIKKDFKYLHNIPEWLKNYWYTENKSSFPSGHTIFSVTWTLLAVSIAKLHQKKIFVIILIIWAISVIASRMFLGMHWPKDITISIIISWIIILPWSHLIEIN